MALRVSGWTEGTTAREVSARGMTWAGTHRALPVLLYFAAVLSPHSPIDRTASPFGGRRPSRGQPTDKPWTGSARGPHVVRASVAIRAASGALLVSLALVVVLLPPVVQKQPALEWLAHDSESSSRSAISARSTCSALWPLDPWIRGGPPQDRSGGELAGGDIVLANFYVVDRRGSGVVPL